MLRSLCLSCTLVVAFTSCAPPPERIPKTAVVEELQRAAMDAKAAQWQLAAIQQAKTGTGLQENGVLNTPPGLDSPLSLSWVGPYQGLVSTVAAQTGYGFESIGNAPVNPIIVRVNAEQIPAIVVLRDASWQVRDRASLRIDQAHKTLHVQFHHDE